MYLSPREEHAWTQGWYIQYLFSFVGDFYSITLMPGRERRQLNPEQCVVVWVDVRSEQLTVHLWKLSFLLPPHCAPLSLTDEFLDVDGLWSYVCIGHWMSGGDCHGEMSRLCRKVYWRETRHVDRWELTGWTSAVVFHICCDFRYFIISSFIFEQLELLHANVTEGNETTTLWKCNAVLGLDWLLSCILHTLINPRTHPVTVIQFALSRSWLESDWSPWWQISVLLASRCVSPVYSGHYVSAAAIPNLPGCVCA